MTQRAHGEGVPSLGKEMDFRWNTCLVQRSRIDYAIANRIDGIVPSLKKKCWRGHLGNFDTRIKRAPRSAQVAWEHCDGNIGPEIGRAVCREGVCRNVEISVGG